MPTYEYRCRDCGHTFDAYQAFTDDALTECPECAGSLKKVFGSVGISFKGSGFYKTDSRSGATAKAKDSDSTTGAAATKADSSDKSSSSSDKASGSEPKPKADPKPTATKPASTTPA